MCNEEKRKLLEEILCSDNVVQSINNNLNILVDIIPEIKDMFNFPHNNPYHHLDVWNHTLLALSFSENDFDLRLCLLLHDIGKPHSYQDGIIRHFQGHPKVSSLISNKILTNLEYPSEYIDKICYLILNHDNIITKKDIETNLELSQKRYMIQHCDVLAHNPEKLEKKLEYLNAIEELFSKIKNVKPKKIIKRII